MQKIGWFTTGRDREAVNLLNAIYDGIIEGRIDGRLSFIFQNRVKGEGPFSDQIIEMAHQWQIPLISMSSAHFKPALRKKSLEAIKEWREEYHCHVAEALGEYTVDFSVLAGYMLIVGPSMCKAFTLINLHPAPPGGPAGTWQEVIWQLIEKKAHESGVIIHKVTPDLDTGPVISYCTYSIYNQGFSPLWAQMEKKLEKTGLASLLSLKGEANPLFAMIRQEGVKRELPLLLVTIRNLCSGIIKLKGNTIYINGMQTSGGACLNTEIEGIIRGETNG